MRGEGGRAAGAGVIFRNINIEDPRPTLQQFFICMTVPPPYSKNAAKRAAGDLSGILFQNISIAAPSVLGEPQILWGQADARIRNLTFENLTLAGQAGARLRVFQNQRVRGRACLWIRHRCQAVNAHFIKDVDPFVKPGDPASGLLPHIHKIEGLKNGQGDKKIQAYNYRVCLTTDPQNLIPIEKPAGYRELDHELLLRNFDAGDPRLPALVEPLAGPGLKVDWNSMHAVGSDFPGANWDYPEASYERRREIEKEHETYIRGFLWSMANNPRVPEGIRKETAAYGLPKDEFTDNDGWPWMIYIREARRMVGDYVMTQRDCEGKRTAPDPVGLGSFGMDSHVVQRFVTESGKVQNDGVIWRVPPRPYGISYRAIIPKKGECENLLSPICVSASHVAHGSIRMEPVFMVLSQSAAIAAGLAMDGKVSVQDVPYPALREKLEAAKQIVEASQVPAPKPKTANRKSTLRSGAAWIAPIAIAAGDTSPARIKAYYTRLPFDDRGFTGKFADIVVELPQRGQFIFSREFGHQPYWIPVGGKQHSVARLIPRKGDGPDERPDNHNIACHAAIVAQTDASVTVRWRYAPDITLLSFTDFRAAYNEAGNPSPFYAEYAEEYFTIHADGRVVRTVKNGCCRLDDWNDPGNQIEQTLQLNADGIQPIALQPAKRSGAEAKPVIGAPVKTGGTNHLVRHWRFDEGAGDATCEAQSGQACEIGGAKAWWRPGVSGTCLSFDSYSSAVTLPAAHGPGTQNEITVSAWIAIQEYPFNLAAIVDHLSNKQGYFLGISAGGQDRVQGRRRRDVPDRGHGAGAALPMGACRCGREKWNGNDGLSERQDGGDQHFRATGGRVGDGYFHWHDAFVAAVPALCRARRHQAVPDGDGVQRLD
jgi:hypothetical protein